MKTKLRALVGGVALLLVLAACYPGISSQASLGFEVQASITKGKVNLDSFADLIDPDGLQGPFNISQSPEYIGTGHATVDLTFNNSKGNWSVTGRWMDGPVKMEFTGKSEYLAALMNACLSTVDVYDYDDGIIGAPNIDDHWYPYYSDDDAYYWNNCWDPYLFGIEAPGYVDDISTTNWIKGGCVYIPTLYRSLNSALIGTGHALILVCQNGTSAAEELGAPLTLPWDGPSYIEVWIPDTTAITEHALGDINIYAEDNEQYILDYPEYHLNIDFEDSVYYGVDYFQNDNSPFRNYYAGGYNTNRSGKWIVQARVNQFAGSPMPTESPLFNSYYWGGS